MKRNILRKQGYIGTMAAALLVTITSCNAPGSGPSNIEPASEAQLHRCAAEFSAKKDHCEKNLPSGSEKQNKCLNDAAAAWNACLAGKR